MSTSRLLGKDQDPYGFGLFALFCREYRAFFQSTPEVLTNDERGVLFFVACIYVKDAGEPPRFGEALFNRMEIAMTAFHLGHTEHIESKMHAPMASTADYRHAHLGTT